MNIKETIGGRIKTSRKALGLTTKDLAEKIGTLSSSRISNWEQGTRSPGPVEAKLLAQQLQVSASYLLGLTDHPQGELTHNSLNGMRHIPLVTMKDVLNIKEILKSDHISDGKSIVVDSYNSSLKSDTLFSVIIEDNSMQPIFEKGSILIIDGDNNPSPGDFVLAHFPAKNQTILRKYGEIDGFLFQLLPGNELWATINVEKIKDVQILGVVIESRGFIK